MLLAELLRKYENTEVVVSDRMRQWDIHTALTLSSPRRGSMLLTWTGDHLCPGREPGSDMDPSPLQC